MGKLQLTQILKSTNFARHINYYLGRPAALFVGLKSPKGPMLVSKMLTLTAASAFVFAVGINAQAIAPVWGQCGGTGWTGPTACKYCFLVRLRRFRLLINLTRVFNFSQVHPVRPARSAAVSRRLVVRSINDHIYYCAAYYSQCLPNNATPPPPTSSSTTTSPTITPSSSPPPSQPTDVDNPYVGYNVFLVPEYIGAKLFYSLLLALSHGAFRRGQGGSCQVCAKKKYYTQSECDLNN
jgi:Fungal cellulose binding domain